MTEETARQILAAIQKRGVSATLTSNKRGVTFKADQATLPEISKEAKAIATNRGHYAKWEGDNKTGQHTYHILTRKAAQRLNK